MPRYLVFDTETPNARNDRMCQIGWCLLDGGRMLGCGGRLVDPECGFDGFNMRLHGITPELTAQEPNFAGLWRAELEPLFTGSVFVAHNAVFDMCVLAKCLAAYGIAWRPRAAYIDTVRAARRAFPELPNHRLDTLARALGLEMDHHNAASDALACAGILLGCERRGVDLSRLVRGYDLCARRSCAL